MRFLLLLLATIIYFGQPLASFAQGAKRVTVKTQRGVTQPFLFMMPDKPKAGVILFVGGDGVLKLSGSGSIGENKNNFLVRTFDTFTDQGLMVALVDVPSDMEKGNAVFRIGTKHAGDMVSVIKYMQQQTNVPIWLVGTSMGSFSAASIAIKKQNLVAGLVLTSSVTRPEKSLKITKDYPDGVAGLNLKKFKKPALIVSHGKDTCEHSPPGDAAKLKSKLSNSPRVDVVLLDGGKGRKSDVCEGLSRHGFYGIESDAVKAIAAFIQG